MKPIAWYHFRFDIPDDWEPTAYAVEPRAGRLEFSNRHGYQAMISWEPCARQPDRVVAMMSLLQRKLPPERTGDLRGRESISTVETDTFVLGWHDGLPAQAVGFLPEEKILLRWIFPDGGEEAVRARWLAVVDSFAPNTGPWREYRLFGLAFFMPAEFTLEEMNCLPANVRMTFENRTRLRITLRRWGLPEVVLAGKSLAEFALAFLEAEGCRSIERSESRIGGCRALLVSFSQRGQYQMDRFMGRWWRDGRAVFWHDEAEKRIYACEQIGPDKAARLSFNEIFPQLPPPIPIA